MPETIIDPAAVVQAALRAGADAAEAVLAERGSLSVGVRLGKLEEVEREESRDLGLRVFVGARAASVSTSSLGGEAVERLVERVIAMARLAPEDPYAGFAPQERLWNGQASDLDLYDASEPSAETLEERARAAEAAALAVDGVRNSDGGSASWSTGQWRLVTSDGFDAVHRTSGFSLSASAIAGEGVAMERAGDGRSARHEADLPDPEGIGAEAGRRAVAKLGGRKIGSTTAAVVFENRSAMSIVGPLLGAISGPAVARGVSFLKNKLGARVFAAGVDVVEDPFRPRGLGSSLFDDEGVGKTSAKLIDDGMLTTWLLNSASARQLGLETTGHASRGLAGPPGVTTSGLYVAPGTLDCAGLMRDAGQGLLVTGMFGPSLNGNTGDWSAGASGFWFENGEVAYPVTEITVAGNLIDMYARLIPGSDLEFRSSANAPSLLIAGMADRGK